MINDVDVPIGSYCWVLYSNSLEIMKKEWAGVFSEYSTCGLWEGTYTSKDFSIISIIPKPEFPILIENQENKD